MDVFQHLSQELMFELKSGFNYSALILALNIPAICATIEYGGSEFSTRSKDRNLYTRWLDEYTEFKKSLSKELLTSDQFYDIRCKILHNGRLPKISGGQIVIQLLGSSLRIRTVCDGYSAATTGIINENNKIILLDIEVMIINLIESLNKWRELKKDTTSYKEYIDNLAIKSGMFKDKEMTIGPVMY